MQAYDLVKLRSTAPCRIVGIAAASEGGAVAGVIGTRQSHMSRSHFRLAGRPANFSASTTSARSRAYPFPLSMAVRASAASENQINQLIKCALDCARAWGRCASPLLSSVMFVPLRAGYDIANQGVKKSPAAEIGGRTSSDRAVGSRKTLSAREIDETHLSCIPTTLQSESSSRHRGCNKALGPSGARAQLGSSAALPSWMTAWMLRPSRR